MRRIAHIRFRRGGLVLPAASPYERQLVLEHAEHCTRHGTVRLDMAGRTWEVAVTKAQEELTCTLCSKAVQRFLYQARPATLCPKCMRNQMQTDEVLRP